MSTVRADHRADDRKFVHHLGELWEQFADLDAIDIGGYWFELSANFGGGIHLEIEHVLVRRTARQENIDECLVRSSFADILRLGLKELREHRSCEPEGPDSEKPAARVAVAKGFSVT